MADKKQNGPIVIKIFETCTGQVSHRLNCVQSLFTAGLRPFRNPMNIVLEQPRAKNGSLFRGKNVFFC